MGCSFPQDYRRFLSEFGAGIVGSRPVFGLSEPAFGVDYYVGEASERFRSELPSLCDSLVVVSMDLGGSPVGFLPGSETILCMDHDFGGRHVEANSFSQYLERLLEGSI